MTKKSIFGLDPEKLDRLLSIGTDGVDGAEPEDKKSPPAGEDASAREPDGPSPAALLGISAEQPGSRIGPYKLIRVLGEGGMGIVYLAEQDEPIRRQVALKVIKPGMDSTRIIARFEAEKQALALLDHPNIAHVYDAGTTENARPYFVMEYVKGLPITEHCDRQKLTIEDRLGLFLQICQAVHHAHQKGIIHRDIKPSNILVSTRDDQAAPKIIDFGVAKAISQPLTERTQLTEQGQLFGTPEYMSPEQANIGNEDIDTRSDIYSLGVLLYVLLTGVLPFDSETLRQGGLDHIRQVILDTEPEKPSTRLTSLGQEANSAAENRCTAVATLAKRLHRELEWIPLKAMRKERKERYQSALELAEDIENYLSGAALTAGPPTTIYRLKKFVRRNRAFVTGAAAVLVVVVAGMITSTVFAIGQTHARAEAERQETLARAVSDFFTEDVFQAVSPFGTEGREATARSLLDIASENVQEKFAEEPLVEALICSKLGGIYRHLGELKIAEQHIERALLIQSELLGPEHTDTLNTIYSQISLYFDWGRSEEALPLAVKVLEARRRVLGEEHPDTVLSRFQVAASYRDVGRYDEAEPLYIETLEVIRRVFDEESIQALVCAEGLARMYSQWGKYDKAEPLFLETLETKRRVLGEDHPSTLTSLNTLAESYRKQGRYDEAETFFRDAWERGSRVLGEEHPRTLHSMNGLARVYQGRGLYSQAEPLFLQVLQGRRSAYGDDDHNTLWSIKALIALYEEWGKPELAEPWRTELSGTGDKAR